MFHPIPALIQAQMARLEARDAEDRLDGTERMQRLRQITPDTGKFLAVLAACAPAGEMIEIGTSAGYSALWLSLSGRHLTTFEILAEKANRARETFRLAGIAQAVTLIEGDALASIQQYDSIAFCFLDAEKEVYAACYEQVVPRLVPGGLLVADNATSHQSTLQPVVDRALADPRVDALVVPIGKGELVCRKV